MNSDDRLLTCGGAQLVNRPLLVAVLGVTARKHTTTCGQGPCGGCLPASSNLMMPLFSGRFSTSHHQGTSHQGFAIRSRFMLGGDPAILCGQKKVHSVEQSIAPKMDVVCARLVLLGQRRRYEATALRRISKTQQLLQYTSFLFL